jgi:26S proteasome regulatory subunit N3
MEEAPAKNEKEKEQEPAKQKPFGFDDIQRTITLLEKAIDTKNTTKVLRAFRHNTAVRTQIGKIFLKQTVEFYVPESAGEARALMLKHVETLPEDMEAEEPAEEKVDGADSKEEGKEDDATSKKDDTPRTTISAEIQIYVHTLVLTTLMRHKMLDQATICCTELLQGALNVNLRTADPFISKVWQHYSFLFEKAQKMDQIRGHLLAAHRTACLRHDEIGQATLLNLLLRNFIHYNLYDQASKLVSKTTFPESASNNQFVRYLFYRAKILAVQLDYSDAHTMLQQCVRKAPQAGNTAIGFRIEVQKLLIVMHLLIGEVPERKTFDMPQYKKALVPYFELTQAVRTGSTTKFGQILDANKDSFKSDKTHTLILRLRHNVIKTGLRKINVSYSKISLEDICAKLNIDNKEDAEFICAKAIRDGVIDGEIDHENACLMSKDNVDTYATTGPQQAFHKRITFCMDVHNEAVKSMQYPPDAHKKDLETAEERAEREKTEEEIAKEIEEDMDEEGI